jgi:hypothetical protein
MWIVFKRRELMNGLFYKFICLLTLCFIQISCWSSPNYSQQPVITDLENIEVDDIHSGEGRDIYTKAILTYAMRYSYYDMEIIVDDIQKLIDGNYSRYTNEFSIHRITKGNMTIYIISAQFNCMVIDLYFSDKPFVGGVSTRYAWEYNQRYSTGENERLQAARRNQYEWDSFFESKYNEAIFKYTVERRKIPNGRTRLDFNTWIDLQELEFHKANKTLWFTGLHP